MSSLHSLMAFRIPWFQISPSALAVRHGLFQDWSILLHAACRFRTFWSILLHAACRFRNSCPGSLVARVALLVLGLMCKTAARPVCSHRLPFVLARQECTPRAKSAAISRFQITESVVALLSHHDLIAINRFWFLRFYSQHSSFVLHGSCSIFQFTCSLSSE